LKNTKVNVKEYTHVLFLRFGARFGLARYRTTKKTMSVETIMYMAIRIGLLKANATIIFDNSDRGTRRTSKTANTSPSGTSSLQTFGTLANSYTITLSKYVLHPNNTIDTLSQSVQPHIDEPSFLIVSWIPKARDGPFEKQQAFACSKRQSRRKSRPQINVPRR
jgi:hypothetical protein